LDIRTRVRLAWRTDVRSGHDTRTPRRLPVGGVRALVGSNRPGPPLRGARGRHALEHRDGELRRRPARGGVEDREAEPPRGCGDLAGAGSAAAVVVVEGSDLDLTRSSKLTSQRRVRTRSDPWVRT